MRYTRSRLFLVTALLLTFIVAAVVVGVAAPAAPASATTSPGETYIRVGDVFVNQDQITTARFWNEQDGLHGVLRTTTDGVVETTSNDQANRLIQYLASHAFNTNQ